jgi:hypothetical protein
LYLVAYLIIYHPLLFLFLWSYYRTMFTTLAGPSSEVNWCEEFYFIAFFFLLKFYVGDAEGERIATAQTLDERRATLIRICRRDDLPVLTRHFDGSKFWRITLNFNQTICRYSLLFYMSMYKTRSSSSLFCMWKMCFEIWSSLSLVNSDKNERIIDLLLDTLGRIVVFLMQIINFLFYFLVGLCYFVLMSQRHH